MAALTAKQYARMILRQKKAAAYRQHALNELKNITRTARGSFTTRNWFPERGNPMGLMLDPVPNVQFGQFNSRYGVAPTPRDVDAFIANTGGNPYANPTGYAVPQPQPGNQDRIHSGMSAAVQPGQYAPAAANPASNMQTLFDQMSYDYNSANQANISRYNEGRDALLDLRDRNQARVGNWGYAASADMEERLAKSKLAAQASMADRGLSNSNVFDAIRMRSDRDNAKEQQRLSEMRDSRMAEYDTRDTNAYTGWVERRNDIPIDPGMLVGIAEKIGAQQQIAQQQQQAALAAAKARAGGRRSRARRALAHYPRTGGGWGNWDGTINWTNGNPVQVAQGFLGDFMSRIPPNPTLNSNRWPTPRPYPTIAAKKSVRAWQARQKAAKAAQRANEAVTPEDMHKEIWG